MRTADERIGGVYQAIKAAMKKVMLDLRVALPGIVQSFDAQQQTATVRLAIREKISLRGVLQEMEIPLLVDVPVVMPRAGGYMLAISPKAGDECLVVFSDRCIDSWWQSGGVQSQADCRRHDLSDGFAILGCWSQPRKPKLPASGVAMQSDDGSVGVFIDGKGVRIAGDSIRIEGAEVSLKGNTVNVNGDVVNITGDVLINGGRYSEHKHSGVENGGGNTGGVV